MNGNALNLGDQYMPYYNIILNIALTVGCQNFLELGLANGVNHKSMLKVVPNCVGVDIEKNTEKFDIIFIDAYHKYEQVVKDFENSIACLEDRGIIFLHDTDPYSEHMLANHIASDSYRMNEYIRKNHPEFDFITLPVSSMGLSICNRKEDARHLKFTRMTFSI
jgi:predicted O-methyltransferase YrrM